MPPDPPNASPTGLAAKPVQRATTPRSLDELAARAAALEGRTLGDLAAGAHVHVPADLRRAKGWIGQLVEAALGAPGGSRPEPDFSALGVELKTIPLGPTGRPRESTYVCAVPTEGGLDTRWETSLVRRKLGRVLWVPIHGGGVPAERRVGQPQLWTPDADQEAALREDWTQLTELLAEGALHRIHAGLGRVLQLRPKAASASDYAWMIGEDGEWLRAVPYGFYLRAGFTASILAPRRSPGAPDG
jgi:DNA mismatch repair protein MutH